LFLAVVFCGSFTTMSAFALERINFWTISKSHYLD
jgi:fluoride ion exporter CrcB/FEX